MDASGAGEAILANEEGTDAVDVDAG